MPRKSSKNTDSISAIHRRRSNRTIPTAPSTTTASASASASASPAPTAFPAPIHVPLTTPIANPKNIDDINWRHPAELSPIYPTLSTQVDIIPLLQRQCFSIPPQPSDPKEQFCEIGIVGGPKVLLPLGYRIPLMFCGKYLWESVRLVLTSEDPPPEVEWENYKFDLLNLSRLCFLFLESARVAMGKKGKGGLSARWRSQMFDRVLTRYWWGWMVNREEYVRAFWMEFKEEEYERDVCRRDWKSMTLKGHKGFHLTPTELASGITAAQYTAGLTPLYDPYPNLYPTAFASLASVAPTPKIVAYKWDNEAYARANELVITGTRVDDDPRYVRIREEERRGYREGEWEGEEGRRRKRIKIEVDGGGVGLGFGTSVNASASKGGGVDKDGDIEMSSIHLNIIPTPPPHPYPHLLSSSPLSPVPLSPTSPTLSLSLPPPTPTPASASETPTPTLEAVANALALPALSPSDVPISSGASSPLGVVEGRFEGRGVPVSAVGNGAESVVVRTVPPASDIDSTKAGGRNETPVTSDLPTPAKRVDTNDLVPSSSRVDKTMVQVPDTGSSGTTPENASNDAGSGTIAGDVEVEPSTAQIGSNEPVPSSSEVVDSTMIQVPGPSRIEKSTEVSSATSTVPISSNGAQGNTETAPIDTNELLVPSTSLNSVVDSTMVQVPSSGVEKRNEAPLAPTPTSNGAKGITKNPPGSTTIVGDVGGEAQRNTGTPLASSSTGQNGTDEPVPLTSSDGVDSTTIQVPSSKIVNVDDQNTSTSTSGSSKQIGTSSNQITEQRSVASLFDELISALSEDHPDFDYRAYPALVAQKKKVDDLDRKLLEKKRREEESRLVEERRQPLDQDIGGSDPAQTSSELTRECDQPSSTVENDDSMAVDKRIKSGADGDGLSPVAGPTSHTAPEQMDTDISMEPVDVDLPTTSRTADGSQILEEHAAAETNDITSTAVLLVEPPSTLNAVSTYTSPKITSTPNPEVINQVLNVVPSMLTHLHSLLDVASSENTLLSSDTNKEAAMAKIQSTTASLFSGQSASNDIITKLTERMNSLESEVKSNQEALKQSNEENARTSQRIIELEERLRTYEASPRSSDPSIIAPNPVLNGISTVRLTTPLSRTSSVDENCPLPIKSQRKQMNLIAMSPSRPPSSGGI